VGTTCCKDSIFLSTLSEKAAGSVVSHKISPDELEKGQCQRMGGCGASSGSPKLLSACWDRISTGGACVAK
jgi:hypothetical protein